MIAGLARLAFFILAVYLATVIAVYFFQRRLQYFPDNDLGDPAAPGILGMKTATVRTDDGLGLVAWFAPPKRKDGRVIVLFHGNGGNIGHRAIKASAFIARGYGVMLAEYRGYGGNPGRPSEEGLYRDARAAVKWLEGEGYGAGQLALYGESLGSGVAVQLATEIHPRIVILEAPFSSAADVAKTAYPVLPVDMLMKDRYDSIDKIAKTKPNLLIVHGDRDEVVPISQGRRLFEAANHPKEFIAIARGAHNDLYDHQAGRIVLDWLDKQVAEGTA